MTYIHTYPYIHIYIPIHIHIHTYIVVDKKTIYIEEKNDIFIHYLMHTSNQSYIHTVHTLFNAYIKLIIHTYIHTGKFLALSATVGNAEELRGWMERVKGDQIQGVEVCPYIHTYILSLPFPCLHTYMHTYIHTCNRPSMRIL